MQEKFRLQPTKIHQKRKATMLQSFEVKTNPIKSDFVKSDLFFQSLGHSSHIRYGTIKSVISDMFKTYPSLNDLYRIWFCSHESSKSNSEIEVPL